MSLSLVGLFKHSLLRSFAIFLERERVIITLEVSCQVLVLCMVFDKRSTLVHKSEQNIKKTDEQVKCVDKSVEMCHLGQPECYQEIATFKDQRIIILSEMRVNFCILRTQNAQNVY